MSWLVKLTCLLTVCICVRAIYFDCRRVGQTCRNGSTCEQDTGLCACLPTHQGHDCGLALDSLASNSSACDPPCQNGACYNDGTAFKCYCTNDAYYGPACEKRRAEATCSGDTLTISIVPYPEFSGLVYIKDNRTDNDCGFSLLYNDTTKILSYEANLAFTSGCSIEEEKDKPGMGDSTYSTEVVIQNSPNFETSLDIVVMATCVHINSGISSVSDGIGTVSVDQRGNLTEDQTSTTYEPVLFEVQNRDGTAISPPLYIGSPLRLFFPLADVRKYTSLLIISCDALNGLGGLESLRVRIIDASCPTPDGRSIMPRDIIYDTATSIPAGIVWINAFRFPNSPIVSFECKVRVCLPGDTACTPPSCNVARKKRNAVNLKPTEEITLKRSVTVLDGRGSDTQVLPATVDHTRNSGNGEEEKKIDVESCFQSQEILVVMAVLIVAILSLFMAASCFALKYMKSRNQVKAVDLPICGRQMPRRMV